MKYTQKIYALALSIIFLATPVKAQVENVVIDISEKVLPSEAVKATLNERVENFLEKGKYFDNRFQGDTIYVDFTEEVATQFPELSRQEVRDYKGYIRHGLKFYRYVKDGYEKYKEKILVPDAPTPIYDDSEYDLNSPPKEYIEAEDVVVVPDFKKAISYSSNPKDRDAYTAKILNDTEENIDTSSLSSLGYMLSGVEIRKLPFYDIIYDSPITGKKGIGAWDKKDRIWSRIISVQTGMKEQKKITALIHFSYKKGAFIKANDSAVSYKPQITFEGSENLKSVEYTMPAPIRLVNNDKKDWTIYALETSIPLTFIPDNPDKPLIIKSQIKASVCNHELVCTDEIFTPSLAIGKGRSLDSSVSTYINQMHLYKPYTTNDKIKVVSSYVEKLEDGREILKIELTYDKKIKYLEAFLSGNKDVSFEQPRLMIDGKRAFISFITTKNSNSVQKKSFELTIVLSKKETLRTEITPLLHDKIFDPNGVSLYLFALAVLGGFLLNLMPCVFPVLSIKLLSLTKFGAKRSYEVRRNFLMTIVGIFLSFAILASFLSVLKIMGQNIGWGIQFQSPMFLTVMILAITIFILEVCGLISIKTPKFINKIESKYTQESFMYFLTGVLIVFMATPCTAPYLATAVGFALAGTPTDIFIILSAIALGLSLPYIIFYLFPSLIIIIPAPGEWMQKLSTFMAIMLFITLIWLFSVLLAQTSIWLIVRLIVYCLFFAAFLALAALNSTYDYPSIDTEYVEIARKNSAQKLTYLILLITSIALFDAGYTSQQIKSSQATQKMSITSAEIEEYVKNNRTVLVEIGAQWCLTCKYNDAMVFANPNFKNLIRRKNVELISIDWTNYNKEVLMFMAKYGRSALPFYIIFSPLVPDGMVLPELLTEVELNTIIENITL